jgi:hypothetical protein
MLMVTGISKTAIIPDNLFKILQNRKRARIVRHALSGDPLYAHFGNTS